MPQITLKCNKLLVLLIFISILFSCSSDRDLLLETILEDPEISIENNETLNEIPVGFETRSFVFTPTNDAYLQGSQSYNLPINRLEEGTRTSYLKFDLSKIPGPITKASLEFTVDSDEGNGKLTIKKGTSTDWTEDNLSLNNSPEAVTILGSLDKTYKIGTVEKINLTSSELNNEMTSFIISHEKGNDLAFASKESLTNTGPKLVVTYNVPIGSDEIQQENVENTTTSNSATETTTTSAESSSTNEESNANSSSSPVEGVYYVTTNGSPNNDGKSEATAWSIDYAFAMAKAGDEIYVKAGFYGNQKLIADNSGSAASPIKFIGYQNTPGDIVSSDESTFKYGDEIDASKMPHLQGYAPNGEGQDTAISAFESYIQIENFQITHYKIALDSYGEHCHYKNIIAAQLGDFNPAHSYPSATSNSLLNYKGVGIISNGDYSKVENCFVLNAGAEGIKVSNSKNQIHRGNQVYSNNNINPTDYYYLVTNDAENNEFHNLYLERVGDLEHFGHGLTLKVSAMKNKFYSSTVKNTTIECSFSNVFDNYFENCKVIGGVDKNGSILIANGAHHNTFQNCTVENAQGIAFADWKDGFSSPYDTKNAGNNNQFNNCTVNNCAVGINFHYFNKLEGAAHHNTFTDCIFTNLDTLFRVDRPNYSNQMLGGKVENVVTYKQELVYKNTYSLNFDINSNTIFLNNGFQRP